MLAPRRLPRQRWTRSAPNAAAQPALSAILQRRADEDTSSSNNGTIWKYGLVVIFVILLVMGMLRVAFIRRRRVMLEMQIRRRTSSAEDALGDTALPPYQPENPPRPRSRWSLLLSPRGPPPEPSERITEEERRRRRLAARLGDLEIRQALIDAGLLLGPERSRDSRVRLREADREGIRALAEDMLAEEERGARRVREERRARRERREERSERRRLEEEGAGLPAYSQKAGGDEEVLEMGEGIARRREDDASSSGSEDEEDAPLQYPAQPSDPPSRPRPTRSRS